MACACDYLIASHHPGIDQTLRDGLGHIAVSDKSDCQTAQFHIMSFHPHQSCHVCRVVQRHANTP
jgi:hypothetical protein